MEYMQCYSRFLPRDKNEFGDCQLFLIIGMKSIIQQISGAFLK